MKEEPDIADQHIPHGTVALMMVVDLLMELKESENELARRVAARFRATSEDDIGKSQPGCAALMRYIATELERAE